MPLRSPTRLVITQALTPEYLQLARLVILNHCILQKSVNPEIDKHASMMAIGLRERKATAAQPSFTS